MNLDSFGAEAALNQNICQRKVWRQKLDIYSSTVYEFLYQVMFGINVLGP